MSGHMKRAHWTLNTVKERKLAIMQIIVKVQNTKDEKKS